MVFADLLFLVVRVKSSKKRKFTGPGCVTGGEKPEVFDTDQSESEEWCEPGDEAIMERTRLALWPGATWPGTSSSCTRPQYQPYTTLKG